MSTLGFSDNTNLVNTTKNSVGSKNEKKRSDKKVYLKNLNLA